MDSYTLLNRYFHKDNFDINNFINKNKPDYELTGGSFKKIIIHYLRINKDIRSIEPFEQKIDDFIYSNYKNTKLILNQNLFQKLMLDFELMILTFNIKNNIKKRL